jgi:hypothetical protein
MVAVLLCLAFVYPAQAQINYTIQVLDSPVTDTISLMDSDSLIFVNATSSSHRFYVINDGLSTPGYFPTPTPVPQGAVIYRRLVGTGVDFYMVVQAEGMANATATIYIDAASPVFGMEEQSQSTFKIYPNPSPVDFTFELEKGAIQRLELYDGSGRLVLMEEGLGKSRQTLFTEGMAKGTYLVRVLTVEGEVYHERIVRF